MKRFTLLALIFLLSSFAAADSLGSAVVTLSPYSTHPDSNGILIALRFGESDVFAGSLIGVISPSSSVQAFTITASDPGFADIAIEFISNSSKELDLRRSYVGSDLDLTFPPDEQAVIGFGPSFGIGFVSSITVTVSPFSFSPYSGPDPSVLYKAMQPDESAPAVTISVDGTPSATTVPEPATCLLLATGLLPLSRRALRLARRRA